MDPVTGALIGGGASLVGSYMQTKPMRKWPSNPQPSERKRLA